MSRSRLPFVLALYVTLFGLFDLKPFHQLNPLKRRLRGNILASSKNGAFGKSIAGVSSSNVVLGPSGDTSGVTDYKTLTGAISSYGAGASLQFRKGNYYFNQQVAITVNGVSFIGNQGAPMYPSTQGTPDPGQVNFIDVRAAGTATNDLFRFAAYGVVVQGITFWSANSQAGQATALLFMNGQRGGRIIGCVFEGYYGASGTGMVDIGLKMGNCLYKVVESCLAENLNTDCFVIFGNGTDHVSIISCDVRQSSAANGIHISNDGGGPIDIWGGNFTGCNIGLNIDAATTTWVSGGGFCGSVHVHGGQYDSCVTAQIQLNGTTAAQYMQGLEFVGVGITNESGSNSCYGVYITAPCKDVIFSGCHINRSVKDNVYIAPATIMTTGIKFISCTNFNPNWNASTSPYYACWNLAAAATCVVEIIDCDFGYSGDYNIGGFGGAAADTIGVNFSVAQTAGYTRIMGGSAQNCGQGVFGTLTNCYPGPNQGRYSRISGLDGYNPVKLLGTQPATSTSAVTNTVGTDGNVGPVDVWVLIGTTATTVKKNGTLITGSLTSASVCVHLDVQETITLSQTTGVTWQWYGE